MPTQTLPKVSIIGAGRVGSTLGLALKEKGYGFVSVISRTGRSAIALARILRCKKASTHLRDVSPDTDILLIATTDDALPRIVKQIAIVKKLKFGDLFVAHTSGVHTADVLAPLRKKGASTASIHPIQTFSKTQSLAQLRARLRGIYFGIDGDTRSIAKAERLVKDLEGKSVVIPKHLKPLYHVVCVFASGYMMVFLNAISELSKLLKLNASWTEVFGPLMTTAMENTVKHSAAKALTGPITRKDLATLDRHLEILSHHAPEFLPLYTVGGIEVARIAKSNRLIEQQDFNNIILRFKKALRGTKPKKISKVKH